MKRRPSPGISAFRWARRASLLLIASPVIAQTPIPLHAIHPSNTTDSTALRSIAETRHLRDGRVLVNDVSNHRLVSFDSTLHSFTVVLGAAGAQAPYGNRPGVLISYPGDSTLFLDAEAAAFILLDPSANVVRTVAVPKANDIAWLVRQDFGRPLVDRRGRLLYGARRPAAPGVLRPAPDTSSVTTTITLLSDSAPILRADFDTRMVDTVVMFRVPVQKGISVEKGGSIASTMAVNPVPTTDAWTVLPDGTIAIARSYDYHMDWLLPDGTRTSSPKMPFDWRRISREEKVRIIDSVKDAAATYRTKYLATHPAPPATMNGRPALTLPFTTVEPDELPDFYPPIRFNQVRADYEGNVWILPATSTLAEAGLVYDVVNRNGVVFERVRLPEGRNLAGFGPHGIVYMSDTRDAGRTILEKAILK